MTDKDWQVSTEIIATLSADDKVKEDRLLSNLANGAKFLKLPVHFASNFEGDEFGTIRTLRIVADNIELSGGIGSSFVISRGKVKAGVHNSIVFANGDIDCGGGIGSSLVICDGNITTQYARRSVVIARGKIAIRHATTTKENLIEDNYQTGFPNIRFFSIRDLGIQLAGGGDENHGLVGVIRVVPGSTFAKSGLRVGECISSVNGAKLTETDQARELFRRAVVEGNMVIERLGRPTLKIDVP